MQATSNGDGVKILAMANDRDTSFGERRRGFGLRTNLYQLIPSHLILRWCRSQLLLLKRMPKGITESAYSPHILGVVKAKDTSAKSKLLKPLIPSNTFNNERRL